MFEEFIRKLSYQLTLPLPGAKAQYLMAPSRRLPPQAYVDKNINAKRSSILILLFPEKEDIKIVLTLRNVYAGVHSGQVSFPGGRYEMADENLINTATRETEEEIGITRKDIHIAGGLTSVYIPVSNFLVSPFVGYMWYKPEFIIDTKEVAEVLEVSLNELLDESIIKSKEINITDDVSTKAPFYDIKGHHIWGATAMIISEFIEILKQIRS